ncbi:MAG: ATP-binding cassette domain-containing protein, partial [Winogradskyella sp.]
MKKVTSHTILKAVQLSIGYKTKKVETTIASNINFELQKGQLIGLVGANGIGKSTLLRTLIKVQPALSGGIFLNDKDLNTTSTLELAKQLSIVLTE